ncbi:hypothetical protein [Tolypothrix sp. VBCCA 56010]|uniref:hypothetical protein n=1 Tax=Tolypothrix sp. VBCCA 56010 TaxID=3137731 RepID=UPI003D7C4E08
MGAQITHIIVETFGPKRLYDDYGCGHWWILGCDRTNGGFRIASTTNNTSNVVKSHPKITVALPLFCLQLVTLKKCEANANIIFYL